VVSRQYSQATKSSTLSFEAMKTLIEAGDATIDVLLKANPQLTEAMLKAAFSTDYNVIAHGDVFDKPHPDPADKSAFEDLVENVTPEKKGAYKAMVGYLFEKENGTVSPTKAKRFASPLQFAPLKKKRGG
jgi:hypothetical protein